MITDFTLRMSLNYFKIIINWRDKTEQIRPDRQDQTDETGQQCRSCKTGLYRTQDCCFKQELKSVFLSSVLTDYDADEKE